MSVFSFSHKLCKNSSHLFAQNLKNCTKIFLLKKKYYFQYSLILCKGVCVAKQKFGREVIQSVIEKNQTKRREIAQLTIKIDAKLDEALVKLSNALNISKNRLIEDILMESGIIQEVEENYDEQYVSFSKTCD